MRVTQLPTAIKSKCFHLVKWRTFTCHGTRNLLVRRLSLLFIEMKYCLVCFSDLCVNCEKSHRLEDNPILMPKLPHKKKKKTKSKPPITFTWWGDNLQFDFIIFSCFSGLVLNEMNGSDRFSVCQSVG